MSVLAQLQERVRDFQGFGRAWQPYRAGTHTVIVWRRGVHTNGHSPIPISFKMRDGFVLGRIRRG